MIITIIKKTTSWFVGVSARVGIFLVMVTCFSVGVIARGADFASFGMLKDFSLFEGAGAVGAVGFYDHIAGVVLVFLVSEETTVRICVYVLPA